MMRLALTGLLLISLLAVAAWGGEVLLPVEAGHFNVKDFGAVGDGRTDDTEAFAKALAAEKKINAHAVIYVPDGTYLLTDTLGWAKRRTLLGQSREGVVLKLQDGCDGFDDAAKPRPFVQTAMPGPYYGTDSRANAAFDNYIVNLTIDTGKGNAGTVGLEYITHNQGMVDNVTIRSGDGSGLIGIDMTATEFGPGMLRNVTVQGFDVGIKTPGNVSHATMEHITLKGQNVVGLDNHLPVSIHDLTSDNTVPAIRNAKGWLAHLVLVGADLAGGSADVAAIENEGNCYLRDVRTSGYKAALREKGEMVEGTTLDEHITGRIAGAFDKPASHLGLPIAEPPALFREPPANWTILEPRDGDCTATIQKAIDSGAKTIFFKPGVYRISDTIVIRGAVRRIFGLHSVSLKGDIARVGRDKPFIRVEGGPDGPPVIIEQIRVTAWPQRIWGMEIATKRPVYLKSFRCPHPGGWVTNSPASSGGKLFAEETPGTLRVGHGLHVWLRQFNPENNPFSKRKTTMPTYIINRGATVWVLGMKTEAPAIHAVTLEGGRTEILGGFFRDHVGWADYSDRSFEFEALPEMPGVDLGKGIPYFITRDASTTASYVQFAWRHGKARGLQAMEVRNNTTRELRLSPDNHVLSLYGAMPDDQPAPGAQD
jgi:hypothetical protein